MNTRRLLLKLAAAALAVVAFDAGLGWFCLRDGEFFRRPVPPYGDVREARWQHWAAHRRELLQQPQDPAQALVHDAVLGWTNAKDFRSSEGVRCFNSRGLRGSREFEARPGPDKLRVALFGESFIYGEEVDDGDEFAAQLGVMDPGLEVMNFGVSGFGTDQALMRLRSEGVESHAQVICIGVMLENIVRNVSRFTCLRNPYVKGLGIKPRFRLVHDALVLVPSPYPTELDVCNAVEAGSLPEAVREYDAFAEIPYDNWVWKSSLARLYIGWRGSRVRDYRRAWHDESGEPFQLLVAILQAFDAEARAAGAERTLVLVFPPKEDLDLVLGGGAKFWTGLARELALRHIECLDLTDALALRARELAGPAADSSSVFLRAHLNRAGNETVARTLLPRLRAP
ncbi:MAG: hypothetical protein ABI054_05005 [Planctomycetota bacterium]